MPSPGVLSGNDFGIIGVLSPDYATYYAVKAALRTLAIHSDQDTIENGHSTFISILRQVKWPEPTKATVKPEKSVKKEPTRKPIPMGDVRSTEVSPDHLRSTKSVKSERSSTSKRFETSGLNLSLCATVIKSAEKLTSQTLPTSKSDLVSDASGQEIGDKKGDIMLPVKREALGIVPDLQLNPPP